MALSLPLSPHPPPPPLRCRGANPILFCLLSWCCMGDTSFFVPSLLSLPPPVWLVGQRASLVVGFPSTAAASTTPIGSQTPALPVAKGDGGARRGPPAAASHLLTRRGTNCTDAHRGRLAPPSSWRRRVTVGVGGRCIRPIRLGGAPCSQIGPPAAPIPSSAIYDRSCCGIVRWSKYRPESVVSTFPSARADPARARRHKRDTPRRGGPPSNQW